MIQPAAYRVLNCYIAHDVQTFAELCKLAGYPTDLGGYYIRQLVNGGYLAKTDRGEYTITAKGKQQMAVAKDMRPYVVRPRLTALIVPTYKDEYVVVRRGRQPFPGVAEWPAGSVNFGESVMDAAQRVLAKRMRVAAETKFVGFFRRTDYYLDVENIFDDKLFAVHTVVVAPEMELQPKEPDALEMYSDEALASVGRPAKSLLDIYNFVQKAGGSYQEHTYLLQPEDLNLQQI